MAKGLHYIATLDDTDFKKKFADQRRMILDSGKTAEAEALKVESMFKRAGIAAAGYLTAQQALSFGQDIIRVRGERQLLEQSFEVLLQSRAKANKMISEITNLAINSPLEMTPVANAAQTLLGFGVDATRVMPILGQLSDVSMGNQQRFESLALVYAQVQSAGKLMGQDLLQMINAGFNPLTIIADQTGKSVAQLKDEMSKGAISADMVTAAFERVTSEGGKFYQMTQKQADGIIGNQATFEDAIVQMKNKIGGNYEDIIKGGYKAATAVVENYEEIGDAIMVLIATYGTYRAALIVTNAAEKLNTMILRQAIVEKRLAAAAGITLTNAEAIAASKTKLLSVAKMGLVKSLKAVSSALLAHPYALVLAAVVGLGYGMHKFANQTDATTKAQAELSKHLDEETTKLNKAHEAIAKAKKGTEERKTAIDNFNRDYGKYLGNLLSEKSAVEDVALAYNQAKTAVVDYAIEKARESYMVEPQSNVDKSKTKLRSSASKWGEKLGDAGKSGALIADIDKIVSRLEGGEKLSEGALYKALGDAFAKQAGFKDNSYNAVKTKEVALELQREFGALQTARNEFESFSTAYRDASVTTTAQVAGDSTKTITTVTENLNTASEALAKAKQEIEEARKADADKAVVKAKQDAVDYAQKNYNDALELTGIDPQAAKKATEEAAKAQKEIADAQLAATKSLYDAQTELKRKQIEDKIKLMEFDRDQTLKRIDEQIIGAKSAQEATEYTKLKEVVVTTTKIDIDKEKVAREKDEIEKLDALLALYASYEQQRAEIAKKYDAERTSIENSNIDQREKVAAIENLEKKRAESNKAVNDQEVESMQKSSDLLVDLFEGAANKSVAQILKITNTCEDLFAYLSSTKTEDITPQFGFTAEQLMLLKASPEAMKAVSDAMKSLNSEATKKNPFAVLAKDIKDLFEAKKTDNTTEEKLAKLGSSAAASSNMIGSVAGDLSAMFSAMGNEEMAGVMNTIQGVMSALSNIGEGFAKGGLIGGIGAAVGELAKGIGKIFQAESRHREAIKVIQGEQLDLQREYILLLMEQNLLYEQGNTLFGADDYGKAVNAVKVYKQANSELKRMYAGLAEIEVVTGHKKTGLFGWGKGKDLSQSITSVYGDLIKADGEFNKALAETILSTRKMSEEDKKALQHMIDLYDQYEAAMQQMRDYLGGIFGDLGNTMSDALVDAFKNGTDAAAAFTDSVSKMLEQLAQQMIYSVTIAPIMEKAQDQMLDVMKSGGLSDDEKFAKYAAILAGMTNDALAQQQIANGLFGQYQDMAAQHGLDIFKGDKDRETSNRGIATASQESVDENNGRLTAIQMHISIISGAVMSIQPNILSMKDSMIFIRENHIKQLTVLSQIADNTAPISEILKNIGDVKSSLETIRDRGVVLKKY